MQGSKSLKSLFFFTLMLSLNFSNQSPPSSCEPCGSSGVCQWAVENCVECSEWWVCTRGIDRRGFHHSSSFNITHFFDTVFIIQWSSVNLNSFFFLLVPSFIETEPIQEMLHFCDLWQSGSQTNLLLSRWRWAGNIAYFFVSLFLTHKAVTENITVCVSWKCGSLCYWKACLFTFPNTVWRQPSDGKHDRKHKVYSQTK